MSSETLAIVLGVAGPVVLALLAALGFVFRGPRARTRPMDPEPVEAAHTIEVGRSERAHADHAATVEAIQALDELDEDAHLEASAGRYR